MMFIHHNLLPRSRGPSLAILALWKFHWRSRSTMHTFWQLRLPASTKHSTQQASPLRECLSSVYIPNINYSHVFAINFPCQIYCVTKKNWWKNSGDKRKVQSWVLMDIIQHSKWGMSLASTVRSLNSLNNGYNSWTEREGGRGFEHAKIAAQLGKKNWEDFFYSKSRNMIRLRNKFMWALK
jgi:hypothetical protein